jgi:membrane dipeptidase
VGLVCATIYCEPASPEHPGYTTAEEAESAAQAQLAYYQSLESKKLLRIVRKPDELPRADGKREAQLPAIILMEGADPIITPPDAIGWFAAGVRMVGMAWKRTRYAGGTGAPGGLTADGKKLVKVLDRLGMIHDASHLAEESFWDLMKLSDGPVVATHSNCRAFVPTDRQLSDEMIRAIIQRDGVIGINFFDRFLVPPSEWPRRAGLQDVVMHARHICDLAGSTRHVAIGTDMDGGLGLENIPEEIATSGDLPRLSEAFSAGGFTATDIANFLNANWLRFFAARLGGNA